MKKKRWQKQYFCYLLFMFGLKEKQKRVVVLDLENIHSFMECYDAISSSKYVSDFTYLN